MPGQDRYGLRDLGAPWYAGSPSFLRAPWVEPVDVPEGLIAIAGIPTDSFSGQRAGARWGPKAIREASLWIAGSWGSQTDIGYMSSRTGDIVRWPATARVVDTGDVPIILNDPPALIEAASDHIAMASRRSRVTVTLGGDHFINYPSFVGVVRAWRDRMPDLRVAYLHVDSHSDFFDEVTYMGRFNHATSARRVSELPEITRMAWFGINGETSLEPSQFMLMKDRGFRVATSYFARHVGPTAAMERVVDYLMDGSDILYVSVDIDVVLGAFAPATHSLTFEALTAQEFLESLRVLSRLDNLVGFDLCEVAPTIDRSQRTERLAAAAIVTVIGDSLFDVEVGRPATELAEVFWN